MGDDAGQAGAGAMERAGPAAELAYRLRQQELAAEFGRFALGTHDVAVLLQEATRVCASGLRTKFCKAMEHLPEEGRFVVRAGVGWRPGVVGDTRVGADLESPAGYAFQTGEPVISNDIAADARFRTPHLLREHGITGAINVPIQGGGARFGVLEVDSSAEGRFSDADTAFLQGFSNLLGVAIERQRFETALIESERSAQASEALLRQAAAHQEVLTREISHRVKNSLAIVASVLGLQARSASDPLLKQGLADAQARVQTIAQVHDHLWRKDEVRHVDLADFMDQLCKQLQAGAPPGQTLDYDVAATTLSTDRAVVLALLVNELVTNAFKYAYGGGEGVVRVIIAQVAPAQLSLEVSDRGVGVPATLLAGKPSSLGMKLISSLAAQLGGHVEWRDARPGARFVMTFAAAEAVEA